MHFGTYRERHVAHTRVGIADLLECVHVRGAVVLSRGRWELTHPRHVTSHGSSSENLSGKKKNYDSLGGWTQSSPSAHTRTIEGGTNHATYLISQ